ncbi:hypothetical protein KXR83_05855 [Williamsia muralis]|uniref:hypothetical protein n=1 Tax=Williamsia marianensis TaxID=85044 RepID=UPI003F17679E
MTASNRFGLDPTDYELINAARDYVQETPRLQKYRKTITNVAALIVNVLMIVIVVPTDIIPADAAVGIAAAIQSLGALVSYAAPNALTPDQAERLAGYLAERNRTVDGRTGEHRAG